MLEPKKKMNKWIKVLIVLCSILGVVAVLVIGYLYVTFGRMRKPLVIDKTEISQSTTVASTPEPGASDLKPIADEDVIEKINESKMQDHDKPPRDVDVYLLYGLDSRLDQLDRSRSDVIMFFVVDWEVEEIRLVSLQRDILIEIPGKEVNRINASYALGGLDLALLTIEHNFDIIPDNVFVVNFNGAVEVIDALGGVMIDVRSSDISERTRREGLKTPGYKTLTGAQALAYMRNREKGGDQRRTERQRNVVTSLLSRRSQWSLPQIISVINTVPNHFHTDMNEVEMVKLISKMLQMEETNIQQLSIPIENSFEYANYKGRSVIDMDFKINKEALHAFIYRGEIVTTEEEDQE